MHVFIARLYDLATNTVINKRTTMDSELPVMLSIADKRISSRLPDRAKTNM
jgi:hypothetical protein